MPNETVVVIPTYNERENIEKIIKRINQLNLPLDIMVVDDNSPDGTGELVESIGEKNSNVKIIHKGGKEGIGPAYVEAFRRLLKEENYKYIIQMDADFSHNPDDIPRLLEAAKSCDVVVGSRYVKGGAVSGKWNIFRKLISKTGNIYAGIITGLKINDCTAGFKCYRKEALESLNLNKRFLNGYGFQVEILYRLRENNFKICEIPIFFDERIEGNSKMSLSIVIEAFFSLMRIRLLSLINKK